MVAGAGMARLFVRICAVLIIFPDDLRRTGMLAYAGYCLVVIGTTAGPAWILWKQRGTKA
jgi:hypothetical protein